MRKIVIFSHYYITSSSAREEFLRMFSGFITLLTSLIARREVGPQTE